MSSRHRYVADRYGAATRKEFIINVSPPNISSDEVTGFAYGTLDSVCSTYQELGYVDKANACLGATMSLVNMAPKKTSKRRLAGGDVDNSSMVLREAFVNKVSPRTPPQHTSLGVFV